MKVSERLAKKILLLGIELSSNPERLRVGHWQLSAGAWRWIGRTKSGQDIGSQNTMLECVTADKLITSIQAGSITVYAVKNGIET